MLQIGKYAIHSIETGRFRLDGGSMFGVVPKAIWNKVAPSDELNRIRLSMRVLVAVDRAGGRVILVDSGPGEKWSPKEIDRYAFEVDGDRLGAGLQRIGVREEDVTDVIVSHLHFDHNGGLTRCVDPAAEQAEPRFRRARHWIHRRHLDHALNPTEKDRASFLRRDFESVIEAGLFSVLDGDAPESPFEQIRLHVVHGHTPYQMLPWFADDNNEMLYTADLIPTFAHLPVPFVMGYDNEPLKTLEEKKVVYDACHRRGLWLASEHDPEITGARIAIEGKRIEVAETIPL